MPFHSAYAPVAWRDFWTFGCGALGDFGCHDLDSACWALNLHAPTSVEVRPAGHMDADIAPHGEMGYFEFDADGDRPPVTISWYSGGLKPQRPEALPEGRELPPRGVLFVGDQGVLLCGGAGGMPQLLPQERDAAFAKPEATLTPLQRPPSRLDRCDQRRTRTEFALRVWRAADRNHTCRARCAKSRQTTRVGSPDHVCTQRSGN